MNKERLLSFILGVVITYIVITFLPINKDDTAIESEENIKTLYQELASQGIVEGVSDDVGVIWQEISKASQWKPDGDAIEEYVLEGKTFYSNSREELVGTLTFDGDATEDDVMYNKTLYSDSGELLTGNYKAPEFDFLGDASVTDVLLGNTFYSNSGELLTGSYECPEFNFLGNASVTDVLLGNTFYSNSGELLTGSYEPVVLPDYEAQSLQGKDFRDSNGSDSWSSWTKTNSSPEVWYDEKTGLYWSPSRGSMTNDFSIGNCGFFSTEPRGDYNGGDVPNCGNAIEECATLSMDANGDGTPETTWYLPTQAELIQGYINGIYLSTSTSWVTTSNFWSSTESQSTSSLAWSTYLNYGYTPSSTKTSSYSVRCVLRDI